MVALAPITNDTSAWDVLNTFPKLHSRAREEKTGICTEAPASKSLGRVEIWQAVYETCDGLESFTRDPIGYFGSKWGLYTIVDGEVLSLVDPSGQRSILPIDVDDGPCRNRSGSRGHGSECRRCANLLRDWIARENARTAPTLHEILDGLPNCPCSSKRPARVFYRSDKCGNVTYTDLGYENSLPEGWAWDLAVSYPILPVLGYQVWSFHPGADKCMRSHGGRTDRSTQQCCYDSNGGLITSGPGAGSPDINDPDHFTGEVDPYLCALYLDDSEVGGRHRGRPSHPGFNVGLYNSLRPSNNGKGCKDNPTPQ